MDKELINEWDIIDTFFRDTDYYKSQHQIDSFDEFIFSKENGIENIIKRENPFILFKGENKSKGSFAYEIRIYYGETLNEDGEPVRILKEEADGKIVEKKVENIFVSSPAIYKKEKLSVMYPNEARLKNLTYKSSILCNIGVHYIFHNRDGESKIINFEKVNIGSIPIMIHSKLCLLHKLDPIKLSDFGECPYDHGGYFIVKGKEKVVLSQEKKVNNILYINKSPEDNIILQGNIKSISNEGFQSSRTNYVSYVINKIRDKDKNVIIQENTFTVRVLGFDINIPLFIMFRALGIISDKDILSFIIYENDNDQLKNKLDFRKNLQKVIDRGLPQEVAHAALTTFPAEAMGMDKVLGRIQPGYMANLVVTDGNYFNPKSRVISLWINGEDHFIAQRHIFDAKGDWALNIGGKDYKLNFTTLKAKNGVQRLASLPLVKWQGEEAMNQLISQCKDLGAVIFNPHTIIFIMTQEQVVLLNIPD